MIKSIVKNLIKNKIPLNSLNYELNLDEKKSIMQGGIYSKYLSSISKLSLNELCILFRTDKASMYENIVYDNEKKKYVKSLIVGHNYGRYYEKYNKKNIKNIVEIGSFLGCGTGAFKCFFNKSKIFALDITFDGNLINSKKIKKIHLDQSDKDQLKIFIKKNKLYKNIDLISDDGSHIDEHILISFKALFPSLKKGGKYFIEDVTKELTPKTYEIFIKNKTKMLQRIKSIKIFKSNISAKTQSKSKQRYLIIIEKS